MIIATWSTKTSAAALLALLATACTFDAPGADRDDGTDGDDPAGSPSVLSMTPQDGATQVSPDQPVSITATFSQRMDPASLDATSFTLTSGAEHAPVAGLVTYSESTATFLPTEPLAGDVDYFATITVGASSESGVALGAQNAWGFMTGASVPAGVPVELGTAGNYVILSKAGITTTPTSAVVGDLAVSPAAATYIKGFELAADSSNQFSTSSQVTGKIYAADYEPPTSATLTTAVVDMEQAYLAASRRVADHEDVGGTAIGGMTFPPGVYHWSTAVSVPTGITLAGRSTDVWIFQVDGAVDLAADAVVTLTGGALAKHVFWQVNGAMTLGAHAHIEGIVLSKLYITFTTGAGMTGRALAQTAVTLAASTITQPTP